MLRVVTEKNIVPILKKGGYSPHPKGNGYIRNINKKGRARYHILFGRGGFFIHIDKTRGYKHIQGSDYPLKGEVRRLGFDDGEIV